MSQQIFLHVRDGRTLWVPLHRPEPHETSPVVMVHQPSPHELARAFYLFDTPVQAVEDAARAAHLPYAKSFAEVQSAVQNFRRRCAQDEQYMIGCRYDPARASAAAPAPNPAHHHHHHHQQHPYGGAPAAATPAAGGPPTDTAALLAQLLAQQNRGAAGGAVPGVFGAPPSPYGAPMHHHHHHHHHHYGGYGRGGASPLIQGAGYGGAPYGRGGYGGRGGGMMMGGGMGGPPTPFQAVQVDTPQPIDIPFPIPQEVTDLYFAPGSRIYCATMPASRTTVWLRDHKLNPQNAGRYVHCKGGFSLMMKATTADVLDAKPVELIDRQLCTHFLAHGFCSRSGCLHAHHSEQQVRQLVAAKHVLLVETTKRERQQMVEDLIEKERLGMVRPKEEFAQRIALVQALPPTFATGTPAHLLGQKPPPPLPTSAQEVLPSPPSATAAPTPSAAVLPGGTFTAAVPPPPPPPFSSTWAMDGASSHPPPPHHSSGPPPPGTHRITGPIGVAEDSDDGDSSSSDSDDSSDSDSSSDDSSSSSSDSDDSSSDSSGDSDGGDSDAGKGGDDESTTKEVTLDDETVKAAILAKQQRKIFKEEQRKVVQEYRTLRDDIEIAERKGFRSIKKVEDKEGHDLRKREKKLRKKLDKERAKLEEKLKQKESSSKSKDSKDHRRESSRKRKREESRDRHSSRSRKHRH